MGRAPEVTFAFTSLVVFSDSPEALSFSKVTAGLGEDGCVYSALTTGKWKSLVNL